MLFPFLKVCLRWCCTGGKQHCCWLLVESLALVQAIEDGCMALSTLRKTPTRMHYQNNPTQDDDAGERSQRGWQRSLGSSPDFPAFHGALRANERHLASDL